VVPLPWVGNPHADGALLGLALILPRETDPADRRALFGAIAAWEKNTIGEEGLPVHLGGEAEAWRVERMEERAGLLNLRVDTWCRPSMQWVSVTPLALDRHPGDLHDSNSVRQARAYAEAEASVRKSCLHIGLPEPVNVQVLPASPFAGSRKAKHYPPYPSEPGRARRQLVHASLEFDAPVGGPVLLGAGRFVGLGLFRPVNHE